MGRTAIVTGSSSGLGEAIAHVLAASGAHVLVHGRDQARTGKVAAAIGETGGRASVELGDLAESADAARDFAPRATAALGGRVDILVNNAGVFPVGPTESLSDDAVEALLATNIRVPHDRVGALAPWMGRVGTPYVGLYPSTKAALEQLTRAWAAEYGPRGVRVNAVAPGAMTTPGNSDPDVLAQLTAAIPAGAPGRPVDIAWAVRYLVSDEAAYTHGTSLDVDGGILATRLS